MRIILPVDFNSNPTEKSVSTLCQVHNLKHLIKESICFKNPEIPTTIDLIVINRSKSFQHLRTFETDVTDFRNKQGSRTVFKRNYKNFYKNVFKEHLKLNLEKINTSDFSLKGFQDLTYQC